MAFPLFNICTVLGRRRKVHGRIRIAVERLQRCGELLVDIKMNPAVSSVRGAGRLPRDEVRRKIPEIGSALT